MNRVGQIWALNKVPPLVSATVLIIDSFLDVHNSWQHQVVYLESTGAYQTAGELHIWFEYSCTRTWEKSPDMKRIA
jgi:hypothetical protein